jgi:tetratricopeptide (TPR) repeat protein
VKAKLFKSRYYAMHNILIFGLIFSTITITSCSHEVVTEKETVTKKEYDELKKKYDDLVAEKNASITSEISVDLKEDALASPTTISTPESQFSDLEIAQDLVTNGDFEKAIETLKKIENSEIKQIKVRVKYLQGEIFFNQKEYDQAMQKYDEIITGFGFSSVAISAIEKKDACKKNLNLPVTQEPYHSIYEDFMKS